MKRIAFGLIWAVVIYFVACMLVGGVAGMQAGQQDPQHAQQAGARAGAEAVLAIRIYLMAGAAVAATLGAAFRLLPGTREPAIRPAIYSAFPVVPPPFAGRVCSTCHQAMPPDVRFCPHCGTAAG